MYRYKIIVIAMFLCILPEMQTQAQSEDKVVVNNKVGTPTITVINLDVNDKTLKLSYEIRNTSKQDVWILIGSGNISASTEVFMDKDDRTLLIREKFDVPISVSVHNIFGRYVLLRAGQTQTESVNLSIPVYPAYRFGGGRKARGLEYAKRLAIEIGYYAGDLPGMIRHVLEGIDKLGNKNLDDELSELRYYFRGSFYFNKVNEVLRQRDEEILLPYTYQWLKGEKVLRTVVEDVRIPYEGKHILLRKHRQSPYIPICTRVEVQFQPSMLEYYFPYVGQQSLLNSVEKHSLQSVKNIVVEDPQVLMAFVNEINKGIFAWTIVREISSAHVACYREDERLISFPIYNDDSVVTDYKDRFRYPKGSPGLRVLTPEIRPFELRVQCANNLRNLWHRLRLYHKTEKKRPVDSSGKTEISYPATTQWCAAIVRACRTIEMLNEDIIRPYICPAVGEGKSYLAKSHYAMNPNCKPDSPQDMVLLFETKAGWNQHGGPELFTFDNHDPEGGCVLLNDGTVKFIRTKEELQQLRWK